MARQPIFVAAHDLVGGTKDKPFTARGGSVVDAEVRKKLGITDEDAERLAKAGDLVAQQALSITDRLPDGQTLPGTTGTEFEGLSIDAMRKVLDDAGVAYPEGASAPDLMKLALEHEHPPALAVATVEIERSMEVKAIKAELDKLQVPYESDANKPALALALAGARASAT
jgi:hypothetical protein